MTSGLRRLALERQGLASMGKFGQGLEGTLRAIEHLGYVQIDTISVVERAPHHVLWSRVPGYETSHLNGLVRDRRVFEYWYHAASYLPMRDYRYTLPLKESIRRGESRHFSHADRKLMKEVLARVTGEGALRQRDIGSGRSAQGG